MNNRYLSDDELKELIETVESAPMLKPPKGFRDDVMSRIRRKRKVQKNIQLFSYSMKVIAATAAALAIVFIAPAGGKPEENAVSESAQKWRNTFSYDEDFAYQLNKQMDGYVSVLNGKLNQIVRMEVDLNEKEEE